MNGDFAAKLIWACAFLFVYSLAGEIFLFKIVETDLNNSRRKNSPQLLDQLNTNKSQSLLYQQMRFNQIKLKMAANNMSNIHVSADVLSTLMLLQQGKLQQQILHDISRSSRTGVFCK